MSAAFDSPALEELEELYVELGDDFVNDPRVQALMEDDACAQVVHAMAGLDPVLDTLPEPPAGRTPQIVLETAEPPAASTTSFTPNWKPNASSQLSDLIRNEQTQLESGDHDVQPHAAHGTNGHVLPHVQAQAQQAPGPAAPFAPMNVSPPGWQMPTPPNRGKPAWFWALLFGAPVTAAAMGAVVMLALTSQQQVPPTATHGTQVAESVRGEDLTAPTPSTPELPDDVANGGTVTPDKPEDTASGTVDSKDSLRRKAKRAKRRRKEREQVTEKNPQYSGKLTTADIVEGVKKNAASLAPCLKAARGRGEIVPGKYRFILDWRIRPDGSVVAPRLKAPASVLESTLPGCFARAMKKWNFKTSAEGAPVKNFPLPLTIK